MSPLRQRMIQDMQLRGFSARTQECYAAGVRQLGEHFHTSSDRLTEENLRQYFLYLTNEKKPGGPPRPGEQRKLRSAFPSTGLA